MVASNEDWIVPVGIGDRRFFVLDVPGTYAKDKAYWTELYEDGKTSRVKQSIRQAMLFDLLTMDLSTFDVRAVPDTAAKTEQKVRGLRGVNPWLYAVLEEGEIDGAEWANNELEISKVQAYRHYLEFSHTQRDYMPLVKDRWAKDIYKVLDGCAQTTRPRIWCAVSATIARPRGPGWMPGHPKDRCTRCTSSLFPSHAEKFSNLARRSCISCGLKIAAENPKNKSRSAEL